jgi:hypothetical protein
MRIRSDSFRVLDWRGSRRPEDRTQRVALAYDDSMVLVVKWANAPRGGGIFNNEPRYELAAFAVQRLFLDPEDYVVPPTALRAFPLDFVREHAPSTRPTFDAAPRSVLVALQYWVSGVRQTDIWSEKRFRDDTLYARRIGNFNLLTHLIRHRDSNIGNFLISVDTARPRVFSVDNGVAFDSRDSDRGDEWRHLRVDRLPRAAVERLGTLDRDSLEAALGVLAEFEIRDGELVPVEPGPNLDRNRGVRMREGRLQLGLTGREIREIDARLRTLVRQANNGTFKLH